MQARDKYNAPQYRTYRGKQVPVYVPPKGMGMIDKVRGELRWTGSDLLILLGQGRPLFIGIDERKHERTRWLHSVSLQMTDPAQE